MDFKMKRIIKPFVPALMSVGIMLLGMMTSCTSDEDSGGDVPTGISLHIQATTRVADGSVNTGSEAENKIANAGVWFFAENASGADPALYYAHQTISSANGELVLKFTDEELRLHHDMNSLGSYQVFVVANLPEDASVGTETTLDDLKNYSYSASVRPGSPFCMTGSTHGAHDFSVDSRVSIPLLRVASRLDIKVVNLTGKTLQVNKISIADDQKSVQLFAPVSGTATPASGTFATAEDIYTQSATGDIVTCSGYVYENRSSQPVRVVIDGSLDGKATTWIAEVKPLSDGTATLPRNSICDMTINLKDVFPLDVSYSIKEWENVLIDNSLDETYVHLLSESIKMNDVCRGEIYLISNADSIQIDLSEAPGIDVENRYHAVSGFYIKPKDGVYRIQVNMGEKIISEEYSGYINIIANNLVYKIPVLKPASSYKFSYTMEYPDGQEFPWYMAWHGGTEFMTGMKVTFERTIPAYYMISQFRIYTEYPDAGPIQIGNVERGEIPYTGTSSDDVFKIPLNMNSQSDSKLIYKIEIGMLNSVYGIVMGTYTYILDVNNNERPWL